MSTPAVSPESSSPRLEQMAAASVVLGLMAMLFYRMGAPVADVDIWHLMGLAREVWTQGAFPTHDPFAYTPTKEPVVHHEWGTGAVLYAVTSLCGGTGVVLLRYLFAAALLCLTLGLARKRGANWATLAVLGPLFVVLIGYAFATIRAQLFSLVGVCLLLWALEAELNNQGVRWWWWAVGFVLWVNLHGGFVFGGGLLGIFGIEQILRSQPWKKLAGYGVAMAGLVMLNPWGWHYYGYLLEAITMPRPSMDEWHPLFESGSLPLQVVFIIAISFCGLSFWQRGWRDTPGCLMVLATAILAMKSQRLILFFAVVWFSYAPAWFAHTAADRVLGNLWRRQPAFFVLLWMSVAFSLGTLALQSAPWKLRVPNHLMVNETKQGWYPVGACGYLQQQQFRGKLLTHFSWGAYASWKLYPQVLVSLDSRYEAAYSDELVEAHDRFFAGEPDGFAILAQYPPDVVLIPRHRPVADQMPHHAEWKLVYRDPFYELYAHPEVSWPYVESQTLTIYGAYP